MLIFWKQTQAGQDLIETMPWPMFQGNSSHTGFVDVKLVPKDFTFAWKTYVGDKAEPDLNYTISQVMANGPLVYVSRNNYVYSNTLQAFSNLTGRQLWKKSFGESEVTPPTVLKNKVYMQALNYGDGLNSGLYHFNGLTGANYSELSFGSVWHYFLSASYYKDNLYFANQQGIYSYNIKNKKINWMEPPSSEYVLWTPAVNEKYVVTYADGKMEVFDRNTGQQIESITDPNYFFGGGTEVENLAPVLLDNGKILGIQGQNGCLTIYDIPTKKIESILGPGFTGVPTVDSNFIYAAQNGRLVVLDGGSTHSELWFWNPPDNESIKGQMLTTDNLIFVSTESNVYAIDKQTHEAVWSYAAGGKLSLGMGHLFIMQHSGDLIAIRVAPTSNKTDNRQT
jgi:outer membrane protein assembly factor BamB